MENRNEIKQEEISVFGNSSTKAMNGELLISCARISSDTAKVRVSMLGGRGETKRKELEVGDVIEYEGSMGAFYKVAVMSMGMHPKLYINKIVALVSKYKP